MSALVDIGMPRLSDSMEEATVLAWLKQPGDAVARGEALVEVETDKATVVYEAEADGVLEEIVVAEGVAAPLGAVIARLRVAGAAPAPAKVAPAASPANGDAPAAATAPRPAREGRARATPIARRLAAQLDVQLDALSGSGPGGRIVGSDVRSAAPAAAPGGGRGTATEVPLTPTQRTIAQRMTESRASIPDFTLEAEIRMDEAAKLREQLRAAGRKPLPSTNDLVVRAVALALREFPALNASWDDGRVLRFGRINVGVAVATDDALIVPTVFDADRKSVFEIAADARKLAERARARTLGADELADGTFTVSNLGMFGIRRFQAVINRPQAAILAVGEVAARPVVTADGGIVARTMMEVALSCDHRIVYGAEAARFVQRLRELLEQPALLLEGGTG
ncbi:MAG TPA: dihydrolipoamide acetyltransferase family protein [Gaiellaceae bacterium]